MRYIWKYLVYCFHIYLAILDIQLKVQIYFSVHITVGLGWNESSVGTLITKHVAHLVTIILRGRAYATAYIIKDLIFPKFVRTYGMCMHHDKSFIHIITLFLPLISFRLCYVTLLYDPIVSQELYHFDTDGSPRSPYCKRHLCDTVWDSHPTVEGTTLCRVCWTILLHLEQSGNWGTEVVQHTGDCPSPC